MEQQMKSWLLLLVFFMLTMIFGFASGYATKMVQIQKQNGLSLICYDKWQSSTDTWITKQCEAVIFVDRINTTLYINSTFNEIKVLQ